MSDQLPPPFTEDDLNPYVGLPVYEFRIGQQVQSALINARWLPALKDLNLHYWFIGDKRPGQPMLRRSIGAIDQYGRSKGKNFVLQRVIATAKRLGEMPLTLQELYDHMTATPAVRIEVLLAPNGMFDFRDHNIVEADRQGGKKRKLSVFSNEVTVDRRPSLDDFTPQPSNHSELHRQALEIVGMSEDQFALLAKPGDDLETLKARQEAQDEGKSLMEQIREMTEKGQREQEAAERAKEQQDGSK